MPSIPTTDIEVYDANIFDIVFEKLEMERAEIQKDPRLNIQNWYLKKLAEIDHARAIVRNMARGMIRSLDAEEGTMIWRHGEEFKRLVKDDLAAKGKGKQMTYFYGRAGFRAVPQRLAIEDSDKAMEWAEKNLPMAIKKELQISVVQEEFKATGLVPPGFKVTEPSESFSPTTDYRTLKIAQELENHHALDAAATEHKEPTERKIDAE